MQGGGMGSQASSVPEMQSSTTICAAVKAIKALTPIERRRKIKRYEELGRTRKRYRRRQGEAALEKIGVPADAIVGENVIQPSALIGLSTATRREIRKIPGLNIAGEQRISDFFHSRNIKATVRKSWEQYALAACRIQSSLTFSVSA
jgi:hypothetical protein